MSVTAAYQTLLTERSYTADASQLAAVARLDGLYTDLLAFKQKRGSSLAKLFNRGAVPRGVWFWGGVGRGKSFLMDCFYNAVPYTRKTRIHFHEFMRSIHRELEMLRGQADPLDTVAKNIAKKYRLICFDEFHVSDVADAMILHKLLDGLFKHGIVFVMTSNYPPDSLYPDGLHRDRILPAIALLKANLDTVNVDAGVDYRRRTLEAAQTYWQPASDAAHAAMNELFTQLAEVKDQSPMLTIENREIKALRRAGGVIWFEFETLCGGPRSQNDYLELATQYHTVFLSNAPVISMRDASKARRLTWLIDVLYDHKVKLFMSAAAAPEALYTEGQMAQEFTRTASRMIEMQSREYLEQERHSVKAL